MAVETPAYAVVHADEPFELRHYDGYLTANVRVRATGYNAAANQGFSYLANYIFGNNTAAGRIAMTSPVSATRAEGARIAMTAPVSATRDADDFVVTFTMPSAYDDDTLPRPNDPRVYIDRVPDYFAATVRFSGYLDDNKQATHERELRAWMADKGLQPLGEPMIAQYDPPWRPWFVRRNEIIVPVTPPVAGTAGA